VAREVGYAPNPHATGLRTSRSNLIGVLVPRLTDLVLATIYQGIEDAARQHGYNVFVANSGDDPVERVERAEMLIARRVDGIILGDSPLQDTLAESLIERKIPFVLVSRRSGNHPSVTCDDTLGGQLAARHLLALGHTKPAVIAGEPYASTGVDRTAAFLKTYADAGYPVGEDRVLHSGFDVEAGHHAARKLLQLRPAPTALFAVNDFAAIGAFSALREEGLTAGKDVAIVGFNDVSIAKALPIPLTTVRSPMSEMGKQSLEMMLARINGQDVHARTLEPQLIVRESTVPETLNLSH
jgi:LacI family transcriptional regulator